MTISSTVLDPLGASWRPILAGGILSIILGVILLVWPGQTLTVLAVIFGIQLLVWGFSLIAGSLALPQSGWGVALGIFSGILVILAGIATLRLPGRTLVALGLLLGAAWIVSGIVNIIEAITDDMIEHRGWLAFAGVISVIAGVVVMTFPIGSVGALSIWAGILMIIVGTSRVILALDLKP